MSDARSRQNYDKTLSAVRPTERTNFDQLVILTKGTAMYGMQNFRSLYKFTFQRPFGDRRDCKRENSTNVQNAEKAIKIKKRDSAIKIKKRDSAAAEAAVKENKSKLRPTSSHETVSSTVAYCLYNSLSVLRDSV